MSSTSSSALTKLVEIRHISFQVEHNIPIGGPRPTDTGRKSLLSRFKNQAGPIKGHCYNKKCNGQQRKGGPLPSNEKSKVFTFSGL